MGDGHWIEAGSALLLSVVDVSAVLLAGMATFLSQTIRAFRLDSLEDRCEDYGQVAYYRGTAPHPPHSLKLDDHHEFFTGRPMLVCGNTAAMLAETRFAEHFRVEGRKTWFETVDEMQAVLDAYLVVYGVRPNGRLTPFPVSAATSTLRGNLQGRNLPSAIGFEIVRRGAESPFESRRDRAHPVDALRIGRRRRSALAWHGFDPAVR